MNVAIENWIDYLKGSVTGLVIMALIALLVFIKFSKWK